VRGSPLSMPNQRVDVRTDSLLRTPFADRALSALILPAILRALPGGDRALGAARDVLKGTRREWRRVKGSVC
jgi:hypothetical protein